MNEYGVAYGVHLKTTFRGDDMGWVVRYGPNLAHVRADAVNEFESIAGGQLIVVDAVVPLTEQLDSDAW